MVPTRSAAVRIDRSGMPLRRDIAMNVVDGDPPARWHDVLVPGVHTERSTFALCLAMITGSDMAQVPFDPAGVGPWLAERGLGLVPVADAAAFAWAGPWIAWRPAAEGEGRRAVVMFGVPSGPIWDPAGTRDPVLGGFVVAPLDIAGWAPPTARRAGDRRRRGAPPGPTADRAGAQRRRGAGPPRARPGRRPLRRGRRDVRLGPPGQRPDARRRRRAAARSARSAGPVDHRRNVVVRGTDLGALIGRRFTLGEVLCEGRPQLRAVRAPRAPERRRGPAAAGAPRRTARRHRDRRRPSGWATRSRQRRRDDRERRGGRLARDEQVEVRQARERRVAVPPGGEAGEVLVGRALARGQEQRFAVPARNVQRAVVRGAAATTSRAARGAGRAGTTWPAFAHAAIWRKNPSRHPAELAADPACVAASRFAWPPEHVRAPRRR